MKEKEHLQSIIKYWRSIEVFNLPDFKLEQSEYDTYSRVSFTEDEPWLKGNVATKENYELLYTLVLGIVDKKKVFKTIDSYFSVDERLKDEEYDFVNGRTLLCSISISQEGTVKDFGYLLPSYIFGIKLLHENKSLDQVNKLIKEQNDDFIDRDTIIKEHEILEDENEVVSRPFSYARLKEEIDELKKLISFWLEDEILVYLNVREVRKDRDIDPPFLNSFYLDDLNKVLQLKEDKVNTTVLKLLLRTINESHRVDILNNRGSFLDSINPKYLSEGRWPNSLNYNLYHAQQGAVQNILHELEEGGVFSVNGPPGTGKTTLLKEVIANVIVKRADLILEVGVSKIFQPKVNSIGSKSSSFVNYYHELDSRFLGEYGIVVTGNNNTAVENISKELPKRDTDSYAEALNVGYFSEVADRLVPGQKNWGILAAVMGNAKNRYQFIDNFWNDDKKDSQKTGFSSFLRDVIRKKTKVDEFHYLRLFKDEEEKYSVLKSEFITFKDASESYFVLLQQYGVNQRLLHALKVKEAEVERKLTNSELARHQKSKNLDDLLANQVRVQKTLDYLKINKPSPCFIHKWFRTKSYKSWNEQYQVPLRELLSISQAIGVDQAEVRRINQEIAALKGEKKAIEQQKSKPQQYFSDFKEKQDVLLNRYGIEINNLPNETNVDQSIKDLHLSMPFYSVKLAQIQSDIFLSALRIHELTIKVNEGIISKNMRTFMMYLASGPDQDTKMMQHLWDSFFLCVPVVSTTLASISKQFPFDLKIGWTLIDEAGQAVPQSAMGILQRSKRAVVIGDPLQIEPVVTIPPSLVEKLREEYQVDLLWSPYVSSLQQLADRTNHKGTTIVDYRDTSVWTGFPLRVHRRCKEPMFSISNKIAYNNQMVLFPGLESTSSDIVTAIKTQWIDVRTDQSALNKHVILEEIAAIEDFLNKNSTVIGRDDVYIISPFKNIADHCTKHFNSLKYPHVKCGTVHTFQGKEAKTVIFILGTDQNSGGARKWASQKPNLVNVAVTRAKKNFIIVGNRELWRNQPYFNTLSSELDLR
ncbi:AAA domain-containing protein [Sphingobacterium faecium]|uniref:AAA domain-containing protein n=1 Tax=Sphingobacterium faecium TaxID=34087 RepID=UPI00320AD7A3